MWVGPGPSDASSMAVAGSPNPTSRKRTVAYALAVAVLVLLLVAGLAFVNSTRVTRVTENAGSLHWTNATLGTAALTRAGLVQAVTFSELDGTGLVEQADLDFAMDQVSKSVGELKRLHEIGERSVSYPELTSFVVVVDSAVASLEADDVAAAKEQITEEVEAAYVELTDSLQVEQEQILGAIADNSADGRALNSWVVFFSTLAVPGSAVIVYFVIARRQVRALRERNRLEIEAERKISKAKDSFIAALSHELKTPLTSIYGFAEVLAEGGVQGREATEETGQIIANEAVEMTRMVDDLLVASRLESTGVEIDLRQTPVGDVIESAVTPFERAGMKIERGPSSGLVVSDPPRLRHVLVNLISNAIRHGGPTVGIDVNEGDGAIDIEVWDNGPGVPEAHVERLFERYVHDDAAPLLTGSVGLGLAVASRLTGLMGGQLRYRRFEDTTLFVVTLPGATAARESVGETPIASVREAISK